MIYDCFLYNGEKELLEIRLNEFLNCKEAVTHILIEAAYTHTGNKKPLYFDSCKEEFQDWPIVSITVEKFPPDMNTPREREAYQRNMIKGALKFLVPSDNSTVIISDVDEIVSHKVLDNLSIDHGFAALILDKFGYYLNSLEEQQGWDRAKIMKYYYLNDKTPEGVRNSGYPQMIANAGWHFSWLHNRALEKLKSFSHVELDTPENITKTGEFKNFWNGIEMKTVPIDGSFPEHLVNNIDKFKHLIKNG
jgi:beta-1,4-mannosyl-glycoprotein beta-1,4-N-acetylglucosaminyltransferase